MKVHWYFVFYIFRSDFKILMRMSFGFYGGNGYVVKSNLWKLTKLGKYEYD